MVARQVLTRRRVGACSLEMCRTFLACVLMLSSTACAGQSETVESQCGRVRDRLVALEVPLADPNREAHKHVMQRALGESFIKTCARTLTGEQRDCVFEAADSRSAYECIARKSPAPPSLATRGTK